MAEATVEVPNPSGLHARPAATFVKAAMGFRADVKITNVTRNPDGAPASAKSMLAVLGLGVSKGHSIKITAEGEDADAAVSRLVELVQSGLGETIA
jgi:phosphotransferase system HPr (HPr) family protein